MPDKPVNFAERTEDFAIQIVRLFEKLPRSIPAQIFGKQLLRCGSSVGAHYAEAQHSRSSAEFVAKIDGGRQEAQESIYWLRLISILHYIPEECIQATMTEAGEMRADLDGDVCQCPQTRRKPQSRVA
jgi:four helix bundle protein